MSLAVRSATFNGLELRKIRPTHVESWVKSMSVDLAPGTVKTRYTNVRSVLRAAVRDGLIASDPTEGVRLPRQRKREAAMTIPSPDDVRALLKAADERFKAFVAVCAFAGLRLGEAAALQTGDVDFLRRQLNVARQVQRAGKGKVDIRLPKYGSERVVPIPDELVTMLSTHVALGHRGEWLFQGAGDTPPHQNTVGYWWRETLKAAGLSGIRLHDLRHFYASGLIAAGCDVVTVQRALGHAKASTTLETYSHLWPSAEDKTRKAAATLAGEVLGEGVGNLRAEGGG
jgi:integrase